jgi:adenosine deaminase
VAVLARRAAEQNESYLELMALSGASLIGLGQEAGWDDDFQVMAGKVKSLGLDARVAALQKKVDEIETDRRADLRCDAEPKSGACQVRVRYVYQVLRLASKQAVFAQTMAGFMLAAKDPRVVAVNFVQEEDGPNSMADYHLHMKMVDYAKGLYRMYL